MPVADVAPTGRGSGARRISVQPPGDIEAVELLAPQQAGEGGAQDHRPVRRHRRDSAVGELGVQLVGIGPARRDHGVEAGAEVGEVGRGDGDRVERGIVERGVIEPGVIEPGIVEPGIVELPGGRGVTADGDRRRRRRRRGGGRGATHQLVAVRPGHTGHERRRLVRSRLDADPGQPDPDLDRLAGLGLDPVPPRRLGAGPVGVHRGGTGHDVVVDAVLGVRRLVRGPVQPLGVALVLAEEQVARGARPDRAVGGDAIDLLGDRDPPAEVVVVDDERVAVGVGVAPQLGARLVGTPRPHVAQPQRGQDVQLGRRRTVVRGPDGQAQVRGRRLGVVGGDRPVPLVEHTGVDQLVLGVVEPAAAVLGQQVGVGELGLGVVVAPREPRVRRRGVDVPVALLHVLPVVALLAGEPEQALLEDGVDAVPQGEAEADVLAAVAHRGQPVLPPPVGERPGLVVAEVPPRLPVRAVVLPHRPPLPLRHERPPPPPLVQLVTLESVPLCSHRCSVPPTRAVGPVHGDPPPKSPRSSPHPASNGNFGGGPERPANMRRSSPHPASSAAISWVVSGRRGPGRARR